MIAPEPSGAAVIAWGWAGRALQQESGDLHVVVPFPGGALVALLDGLGHGPEAAAAARAAAVVLLANPRDSVVDLVQRCHVALRKTRGAVMSVASFRAEDSTVTWIGVGNVEGVLLRAGAATDRSHEGILGRGGVVGYHLPTLRSATVVVYPGDTLIMATDGVRSGFAAGARAGTNPHELAESILARFAKGTDDAHVVVARYQGAAMGGGA